MLKHIGLPQTLVVGAGALRELPTVLARLGVARPLAVVDPHVHALGLLDAVLSGVAVFSGVVPDPTVASVAQAASLLRNGGHDAVIGIGGGSAIDTAKAAALLASQDRPLAALKMPASADLRALPIIAIPTTAGTGSEVTRACVVTDGETGEKMLIAGSACMPAAALVDFELTLSCPPRVTADTGLDALAHAIEALVNRRGNLLAESHALAALRLIGPNLVTAYRKPGDRAAREAMAVGALQAGFAINAASTALVHGMGRPFGSFFHLAHGFANAMLLPAVTAFSLSGASAAYARAAHAMVWADEAASDAEAGLALVAGLRRLNQQLDVPTPAAHRLDRALYERLLPAMADQALRSGTPANNPRLASAEDIVMLYRAAWDG